jgi:putative peptide zinc metalloprotease protein
VCQIGDPACYDAQLAIDQADVELVAVGQAATLKLDCLAHETCAGTIAEVSELDMQAVSDSLSNKAGGDVATRTDASGKERPLSVVYQARVPLDDAEGILRLGQRGTARIHTAPRTLAWRAWRWLTQTFRFEW